MNVNEINLKPDGWGSIKYETLSFVLESSTELFKKNIYPDNFNAKPINIYSSKFHSPPIDHPKIYKRDKANLIYLSAKNNLWAKFAYQFSHEFCHHQIESEFINSYDQFGWFEESLCELASIHSLKYMSQEWGRKQPDSPWAKYSYSLKEYADEIINRETNKVKEPLSEWIRSNINELEKDRYLREKNCLVATNLLETFVNNPFLWDAVTYIKEIKVEKNTDFSDFLKQWDKLIPERIRKEWNLLKGKLKNSI